MIEYKRGRKDKIEVANRTTWESRCGMYRVQKCESNFGERTRFYAMRLSLHFGWHMIDHMRTYSTRNAAEKAIKKWDKLKELSKSEKKLFRRSEKVEARRGTILR